MFVSILFLALLLSLILISTELRVYSDKPYQQIRSGGSFTVKCKADVPLIGCQMRDRKNETFFDLSKGSDSVRLETYKYSGAGLQKGECGIEVLSSDLDETMFLYVCRVRSSESRWVHAATVIEVTDSDYALYPVDCAPETVIGTPGSTVNFKYMTPSPPSSCEFRWLVKGKWMGEGIGEGYAVDIEIGKSRKYNDYCELTLTGVSPKLSGFVEAKIQGDGGRRVCVSTFIVTEAPPEPKLWAAADCNFTLIPTCNIGPSRPWPVMNWLAGGKVIRTDDNDELDVGKEWVWEYEPHNITQSLNARLSEELSGREVTCRVTHMELSEETAHTLDESVSIPRGTDRSNSILCIVYLMMGIGTGMLGAALLVALISMWAWTTNALCYAGMEA